MAAAVSRDVSFTEEESNRLLASDSEDEEALVINENEGFESEEEEETEKNRQILPTNQPRKEIFETRPQIGALENFEDPVIPSNFSQHQNLNQICFVYEPKMDKEIENLTQNLDKMGVFHGSENPLPYGQVLNSVKKEVKIRQVKEEVIDLDTDSDDDSDIELVGVVTSDQKKFKVIKIENEEGVKQRAGNTVHATSIKFSERIEIYWQELRNEITKKQPLIAPHFMKGRINAPKYKDLKRTIPSEELEVTKKAKLNENVQVEVRNLPSDWIEQGIGKIENIANAYGENGEKAVKIVKQKDSQTFIVIFKNSNSAQKMYQSLNQRQIDEFVVQVTEPHPEEFF